jgi:hypothetical protein
MIIVTASSIMTMGTLAKLVVGALAAGLGVTVAFSLLIYFFDRGLEQRVSARSTAANAFRAASVLALLACLAIIAYGLFLTVSKPK